MQKLLITTGIFLTKETGKERWKTDPVLWWKWSWAIIEREIWDAAQLEINRIKEFKRNHQIRELGSCSLVTFLLEKFFVGAVGEGWWRKAAKVCGGAYIPAKKRADFVKPSCWGHKLEEYVSSAWAQLVSQRENLLPDWEKDISQGNALERLRAAQMKELTEKYPSWFQVARKTRMVIGEIIIGGDKGCEILFMDGVRLVTD